MQNKTVLITNNKGGVCKTTLSVHLAWWAAHKKYKVLLIDFDEEQANSLIWLSGKKDEHDDKGNLKQFHFDEGKIYSFPRDVHGAWMLTAVPKDKYDLVIVDTKPSQAAVSAFRPLLPLVVIPFCGRFSRIGIYDVMASCQALGWVPEKTLLIPIKQDGTWVQGKRDLDKAKELKGATMLDPIRHVKSVQIAEELGRPLWELPWGGKTLFQPRMEEILKWLKL